VIGAERLALASLPVTPWKNGGGTTREIAASPPGAGFETFDWRLSVAEVERDGPFSAFAGIDRTIVLLSGAGMQLRDPDRGTACVLTQPGAAWSFAGELAIDARLLDGPTRDFNVMTRRGPWSATASTLRGRDDVAPADALLLLAGAGTWQVDGHAPLAPGEMLLWRTRIDGVSAAPAAPDGSPWLLAVRLCQDRSR
jgi:uncharacterized protein